MPAPFAALEARINTAVFAHLANATADLGGGVLVDGIFRKPAAEAFGLVTGTRPSFEAAATALSGVVAGQQITIGVTTYRVASMTSDGTGSTTLDLDEA